MTITARFPGHCIRCNGQVTIGQQVNWTKGIGTSHARMTDCNVAQPVAPVAPRPVVTANFEGAGIAAFILAAKTRGLKFPKVRFLHNGAELRISVAGPQTKVPGSLNVVIAGEWIGRVTPTGEMHGALAKRTDVQATLARIANDPVTCAKEYGALMGCCSFCNLKLTDAGSVEVGYGPICAKHYGLPHAPKGTPDVFEVETVEPSSEPDEDTDDDYARRGVQAMNARRVERALRSYQGLRGRML